MRVIYICVAIKSELWHFHVAHQHLLLSGGFCDWLKRRRLAIVISIHLSLHKTLLTFKDAEVVTLFIPQDDSTTGDNNANHRQASALLSLRRRRRRRRRRWRRPLSSLRGFFSDLNGNLTGGKHVSVWRGPSKQPERQTALMGR